MCLSAFHSFSEIVSRGEKRPYLIENFIASGMCAMTEIFMSVLNTR